MKKNYTNIIVFLIISILLGFFCTMTDDLAGSGVKTGNSGRKLVFEDGTPAVAAKVFIRSRNTIADTSGATITNVPELDSTVTDTGGHYGFSIIDTGTYMLEAYDNNDNRAIIDSIVVAEKDNFDYEGVDTLKPIGSITGIIKLSEGGDPQKVAILAYGINRFTLPNSSGVFTFDSLAEGTYHLVFWTSLDNYDNLDTAGIVVTSGQATDMDSVELKFNAIPTPAGLTATYDTLNGLVTLSWSALDYDSLQGYIIYRNDTASSVPQSISGSNAVSGTTYVDTVFTDLLDSNTYVYEYRIKAQANNANIGENYSTAIEITAASPREVRTFLTLSTANTINDTATINDTVKVILSYTNATRTNDSLAWSEGEIDSVKAQVDVDTASGVDTLTYVWSQAGANTVYAKAKDEAGNTWLDSIIVVVLLDLPVARAGNDTTVGRNDTINLVGSASTDNFGPIIKYEWDIGNTGSFVEVAGGDTNIVRSNFDFDGFNCILRTTDDDSGKNSDTMLITIMPYIDKAVDTAAFGQRYEHTSVVYDSMIWIIGGSQNNTYENDVWYSSDGATWTLGTASGAFFARRNHSSVTFDNKMWVIGGKDENYLKKNDVWYSSDGATWTEATSSAQFSERSGHACVVFAGKIWVIGGYDSDSLRSDVWYSSDGVTWTEAIKTAGFSARTGSNVVVFQNKMWLIGGSFESTFGNDVWYSSDGITWTQATASAEFVARGTHCAAVLDGIIWIAGGKGRINSDLTNLDDIWYSIDGISWSELNTTAQFKGKYAPTAVIFNDKLWIIGWVNGEERSDVWYLR